MFYGFLSSGEGKDFASTATKSWNSVVGTNEINQKWQGKYQNHMKVCSYIEISFEDSK